MELKLKEGVFGFTWNFETGEVEEQKFRATACDTKEFWMPVLMSPSFQSWVKETYQVANGAILSDEDIAEELANVEE